MGKPGIFRTRREAVVFFLTWLALAYLAPIVTIWAVTR